MTNITEKWKKGELPDGWYWCECYNEEIKKLYYDGDCFELDDPETKNYYFFTKKDCAEIEILKEVPSYEECQASDNYIDYLKQCISVYESKEKQHVDDAVAYNELAEENTKLKEQIYAFAEANQSLRKKLDNEKAKNRIDYYNGSPMDFLDECERDRKKNKIYKNWINNIREELIISDLRRTDEGNKFIVNLLAKINQVLGEE